MTINYLILDCISEKPFLYYRDYKRYSNIFGFVGTIIAALLLVSEALYFLINYFNGDQLTIIFSQETNYSPYMNLTDKLFLYMLATQDGTPVDPRILQVIPTLWKINGTNTSVERLISSSCSREKNYPQEKYDKILDFDISKLTCLSKENGDDIIFKYEFEPYLKQYMNIYVAKCQGYTLEGEECFPLEEIDEKLADMNIFLSLYTETIGLDHHNNKNPLTSSYLSQTIAVSNDFKYSYFYDFRKIIYETKEGFLFKKDKVMSDVSFDLSTRLQSIYANTKEFLVPLSLSTFQFSINQEYADKYQRSYQSIETVIANIGGVCNLVIIIIKFIIKFLTDGFIYYRLASGLTKVKKTVAGTKILNSSVLQKSNLNNNNNNNNTSFAISNNDSVTKDLSNNILLFNKSYITTPDRQIIKENVKLSFLDSIVFRVFKTKKKGKILETCINVVRKALSVESIMKLSIHSNVLFNSLQHLNNSSFNNKKIISEYSFSTREKVASNII